MKQTRDPERAFLMASRSGSPEALRSGLCSMDCEEFRRQSTPDQGWQPESSLPAKTKQ